MRDRSTPRLSPGKGQWPKSEKKRKARRYRLEAASAYKASANHLGGFARSKGAASKCISLSLSDAEKEKLSEKYNTSAGPRGGFLTKQNQ